MNDNRNLVLSVVGARPQFVKAAAVTPALAAAGVREILLHTGQHYDWEMSAAFFEGLDLPAPTYNLQVGSGLHGAQTARMLEGIEAVLIDRRPRLVIVYGDTNSTLAGALAGAKLHIPVAHVEAGLRSFNRAMPEEINRIVADHLATIRFAPTDAAVANLRREGLSEGLVRTGDVMYDISMRSMPVARQLLAPTTARYGVSPGAFALATIHRAENTDNTERWRGIVEGLLEVARSGLPVIWPAHPRTRALFSDPHHLPITLIPPLPYLEMQTLVLAARVVITDSGGLQKEAAFLARPCVTVRDQTEWVELVQMGVNTLVPAEPEAMARAALTATWPDHVRVNGLYGDGQAGVQVAQAVKEFLDGDRAVFEGGNLPEAGR